MPALGVLALALLAACGSGDAASPAQAPMARAASSSTPTAVAMPGVEETPVTETPTPPAEEATPEPTPASTPVPVVFVPTDAYVVTSTTARAAPSMAARAVRTLPEHSTVSVVAAEYGENWIIGSQDWVPVSQPWATTWYRLEDGSYVYRAFLFVPDGLGSPLAPRNGAERYVIVDVGAQMAYAMEGSTVVREMGVTTGKPGFQTPVGEFYVTPGGRIWNERMTSQRAGIAGAADYYDVERVLYTQYFTHSGHALHMNYWQPNGVYGSYATSHGCVGFKLPDAQFLWMFGDAGMRVVVRNGGGAEPVPASTPVATPAPPPPPPPSSVEIRAVQAAAPGGAASLAAYTTPGRFCSAQFVSSATSRRFDLGSKSADAAGWLEWSWLVDPTEPRGVGSVEVYCPGGIASSPLAIG